nr:polysaccharide biosynthesis protein [Prevotella sp.]
IEEGGPVTVTDPKIIRFFMTISEACRLVMEAATIGKGSEIFVFDMGEPVKIVDLATRMIELAGYKPYDDIQIKFTGLRPGEKLYEEVLSNEENTIPTDNKKIKIAKVREYNYEDILDTYSKFKDLSVSVDIISTVKLMKEMVPEYKSNHSVYEKFDK